MEQNHITNAELASVLQLLSQHTERKAVSSTDQSSSITPISQNHMPTQFVKPVDKNVSIDMPPAQPAHEGGRIDVQPTPEREENPARSSQVDPKSIVDWSQGLRFVSKLVAQNPGIEASVQKMIKNQRDHEKMWWKGREALILSFESKAKGRGELNEVLGILGGSSTAQPATWTDEDRTAQLSKYDKQVYKAQQKMAEDILMRLESMGIPFFGTSTELIASDDAEADGKLGRKELVVLQMRMLEYLADMYS